MLKTDKGESHSIGISNTEMRYRYHFRTNVFYFAFGEKFDAKFNNFDGYMQFNFFWRILLDHISK